MAIIGKCNDIFCEHNTNHRCDLGEVWIEYGDRTAFCAEQDDNGWKDRVVEVGGMYFQKKK